MLNYCLSLIPFFNIFNQQRGLGGATTFMLLYFATQMLGNSSKLRRGEEDPRICATHSTSGLLL
jgi:hypothetical protein